MQAIEFETLLKSGMIQLPISYQHWQEGKHVKVIVLVDENHDKKSTQLVQSSINRHAGKITLSQDPLDFQKNIRDEWT